jgi:type II secretory pathway pseudopilin PulG
VRVLDAATSQASTSAWWWTPIVGLVGVLCGSLIAAWMASARERRARREESQRAALYELQEAALSARKSLRTYGKGLPTPSQKLREGMDDATSRFEILQERLLCETVRARAIDWLSTARRFHSGYPEVSFTHENDAWTLLQTGVGQELRRLAS